MNIGADQINLRSLALCSPEQLNSKFSTTDVIGCGGIGSSVVMALAKMGLQNIWVFDDDTLEPHNLGNQFLPYREYCEGNEYVFLGRKKVDAMEGLLVNLLPDIDTLHFEPERFTDQSAGRLVIVTVDSMAARKAIWKHVFDNGVNARYFIDARMGAQTLRVYTVDLLDGPNIDHYENSLYDDDVAVEEPCTARGIVYTSMFAGAHVANIVKMLAAGPQDPPWELNHLIEHNAVVTSPQHVQRNG